MDSKIFVYRIDLFFKVFLKSSTISFLFYRGNEKSEILF